MSHLRTLAAAGILLVAMGAQAQVSVNAGNVTAGGVNVGSDGSVTAPGVRIGPGRSNVAGTSGAGNVAINAAGATTAKFDKPRKKRTEHKEKRDTDKDEKFWGKGGFHGEGN